MLPRIIYFVPEMDAYTSGVLHTQVVGQMEHLTKQGFHTIFVGTTTHADIESVKNTFAGKASQTIILPLENESRRFVPTWMTANKLAKKVILNGVKADFIYIRSSATYTAANKFRNLLGMKLVYDCRGLASQEHAMGRGLRQMMEKWILQSIEVFVLRRADKVAAVSSFLGAWINKRTGKTATIIPCCIAGDNTTDIDHSDIATLRKELSIPIDAKVLIYSGSVSRWQCIQETIDIMIYAQQIDPSIYILLLTPQPDKMGRLVSANQADKSRVIIKSVSSNDVARHLRIGDIGFLLRKRHIVNQCASPIKAAEYLSAGLIIALSPDIGDVSQTVLRGGAGVEIGNDKVEAANKIISILTTEDRNAYRLKSTDLSIKRYTWNAYTEQYISVFS